MWVFPGNRILDAALQDSSYLAVHIAPPVSLTQTVTGREQLDVARRSELLAIARGTSRLIDVLMPAASNDALYLGEFDGAIPPGLIAEVSDGRPAVEAKLSEIAGKILTAHGELKPFFGELMLDRCGVMAKLLGTAVDIQPYVEFSGCAIIVRMAGEDYDRYAIARELASPEMRSLATTLAMDELPANVRGRLIIVNGGNDTQSDRTYADIVNTQKHESTHALFNTCFSLAPLPYSDWLNAELNQISDPSNPFEHNRVAAALTLGMAEAARSEIIAYFSTGQYAVSAEDLYSEWWKDFDKDVTVFLKAKVSDPAKRELVAAVYKNARDQYDLATESYKNAAAALFTAETFPPLTLSEKRALLLHVPLDEAHLVKFFLPEGVSRAS